MKEVRYDPCSVEGCASIPPLYDIGRALCKRHYVWQHSRGLLPPKPSAVDLMVKWRRVTEAGCWEWRGSLSPDGYGRLGYDYVHRLSWETSRGPIPDGLQIDHLCRNRRCFRPDHLEPVTPLVNLHRSDASPIIRDGKCRANHEMTPENTRIYVDRKRNVRRICRTCHRLRARKAAAS